MCKELCCHWLSQDIELAWKWNVQNAISHCLRERISETVWHGAAYIKECNSCTAAQEGVVCHFCCSNYQQRQKLWQREQAFHCTAARWQGRQMNILLQKTCLTLLYKMNLHSHLPVTGLTKNREWFTVRWLYPRWFKRWYPRHSSE